MSAIRTADHIELGLDLLVTGIWIASERAASDNRLRRKIHAHNAGVANARAQSARRRAAQEALGAELMSTWLTDREQLH